ncbi:hypothetical protein [Nannocystis punicea]|uniref:Uncharacterized protein n=1 Tax=Nannocystis punicea TaxID=2995304 RepID=A0ABY7H080_9BACT|nr:hypothetical protein [Nannocystis poenicansa]WAS92654.1 hypothetical protein O0S08_41270 [Nannocystis poenicansa]
MAAALPGREHEVILAQPAVLCLRGVEGGRYRIVADRVAHLIACEPVVRSCHDGERCMQCTPPSVTVATESEEDFERIHGDRWKQIAPPERLVFSLVCFHGDRRLSFVDVPRDGEHATDERVHHAASVSGESLVR